MRTMPIEEFIKQVNKLNNKEKANELLELYAIDQDKAISQFIIALAEKIVEENKSLFERLADL